MDSTPARRAERDIERFYMALTTLLRNYQFRDRDRQAICGITVTQCYALEFVVHAGRLTVLELGKRLALNKSNASRVVDALESAGVVSRGRDPVNHRIRWIQPTAYGRRLHAEITKGLKRDYEHILAPFPPSFVRKVAVLLEALAECARQPRTSRPRLPARSGNRRCHLTCRPA
jgi:DNA-binding MarR family transcriptional regulator